MYLKDLLIQSIGFFSDAGIEHASMNFLIKLCLREGNIAILLVSINITIAGNVFSKRNKSHCVIGIHDNGLDRTYILIK